jgi:hypothetical protein
LLRVEVAGGAAGWYRTVPGVRVVEELHDGAILELVEGADGDRVLEAARAAGRLRRYAEEQASLTEIFRRAVGPP